MTVSANQTVATDNIKFEISGSGESAVAMIADIVDKSVTTLKIPASVNGAKVSGVSNELIFHECYNLENFDVEEGGGYSSIDGVLFNSSGKVLVAYPSGRKGSYVIPEGTEKIGNAAFYKAVELTEVTLPQSLKDVQARAFFYCTSLEKIHGAIPSKEGTIVAHCYALKRLEFAEAGSNNDIELNALCIANCPALEEVIIPESRALSSEVSLIDCGALEEFTIPQTLGVVQFHVKDCQHLKKIKVLQKTGSPYFDFDSEMTIYGYSSNEYLKSYCEQNCWNFIALDELKYPIGDIDGNEIVDIIDVLVLNQYLVGIYQPSDAGIDAADVDHNGKVEDADSMKILKSIVGLETLE